MSRLSHAAWNIRLRDHLARRAALGELLLVIGLASCGSDDDPSNATTGLSATAAAATAGDDGLDVIVARDTDGQIPPNTPVTCDGFRTFPYSALSDPVPVADSGIPGLRAALDEHLSEVGAPWPQDGWLVLTRSDERVLLIYVDADTVAFESLRSTGAGWEPEGSTLGDSCDLRTALPVGLGEVEWRLDPAFPSPDADISVVHLLATERECASGEPLGDRLVGPQVVETDESVLIAFAATLQDGDEECPGNPEAPVTVELPAPLGERTLRDGRLITTDLAELIDTNHSAPPDPSTSANPLSVPTT